MSNTNNNPITYRRVSNTNTQPVTVRRRIISSSRKESQNVFKSSLDENKLRNQFKEEIVKKNEDQNCKIEHLTLHELNQRLCGLIEENKRLKQKLKKGENVRDDLSQLTISIDEATKSHLVAVKTSIKEKERKIRLIDTQLSQYTVNTVKAEDLIFAKTEIEKLREEIRQLRSTQSILNTQLNNNKFVIQQQQEEIAKLKDTNCDLMKQTQSTKNLHEVQINHYPSNLLKSQEMEIERTN